MSMKGEFWVWSYILFTLQIQDEKLYPLAEQLEPELGGMVTGMLGEAMEALQGRKVEEASGTVDLVSVPSSSTSSVTRDAIDPASTASSSSASADGANLAPSPSSSSAWTLVPNISVDLKFRWLDNV